MRLRGRVDALYKSMFTTVTDSEVKYHTRHSIQGESIKIALLYELYFALVLDSYLPILCFDSDIEVDYISNYTGILSVRFTSKQGQSFWII